jgi:hypothetical protein
MSNSVRKSHSFVSHHNNEGDDDEVNSGYSACIGHINDVAGAGAACAVVERQRCKFRYENERLPGTTTDSAEPRSRAHSATAVRPRQCDPPTNTTTFVSTTSTTTNGHTNEYECHTTHRWRHARRRCTSASDHPLLSPLRLRAPHRLHRPSFRTWCRCRSSSTVSTSRQC